MTSSRYADLRDANHVRLNEGRVRRPARRSTFVCLGLLVAAFCVSVASLASGEYPVPLDIALSTLVGGGDWKAQMVVLEWRLPRALAALLLGAALGVSGAIFQSLTRNPLGSPDVVGFDAGAQTGALTVMILLGSQHFPVAGGAFSGGLLAAAAVYLLGRRHGGIQGLRLIVVGIGIGAMLTAFNTWLVLAAHLEVALAAVSWKAGSLAGVDTANLVPIALTVVLLLLAAAALAPVMRQLELGDEMATAHGLNIERVRAMMIAIGVGLTAASTALAGPIAFVALVAPQLAGRLAARAGLAVAPSAAMGALLLSASDFVAHHAFAPTELPAGVVTASLGGTYFIWLLLREARRH